MSASFEKQFETLKEGLVDLISEDEFKARLKESIEKKKPLRIKYGADPSAPDLHLGHTVPLRKLRQFQDFGHTIVFIIGDFTARIGDPTQRTETRKMLTEEEVKANSETYQKQVFGILDESLTEVRYNSEWLSKLKPEEFLHLTAQYTVARLLERDDFQKRYTSNQPISVVEFLYPLMQGYDSVIVKSDIEMGGTDQKFNLLVGRELQKVWQQTPQMVMTLPIIEGLDGTRKMSKSYDNHIAIQDSPRDMFGKTMSIPDTLLERYYSYAAALSSVEVAEILKDLKSGELHPREAKANLSERIVSLFYDAETAAKARVEFDEIFKSKGLPEDIPLMKLAHAELDIVSILKETQLVASKGEGRRLIAQGGVRVNQEKVTDPAYVLSLKDVALIQCGKRKFAKVEYDGRS